MNYELFENPDNDNKKIFLVDMTREPDYIFSELAKKSLKKYITQWKKIWILVNKKWYSAWIFCHKCGYVPKCDKCSVSISYHKLENTESSNPNSSHTKIGLCNICKSQYELPTKCPHCQSDQIWEFGVWTQQIAEILEQEYPGLTQNWTSKIQFIESQKANSKNKINPILEPENIKNKQIWIWTSLLNTPIQWVKLDMILYINADLWLNIPSYSAAKNNFHFLYDTFKSHKCTNFVVQTFNPEHYSIRNACKISLELFTQQDNKFREENKYPPFSDVCVLLYKNEIEERLFTKVDKLHKELLYLKDKYQMDDLEIYSTPPIIYKIFGKYRYNIVLKWKNLRNFMDIVYTKLKLTQNNFKVDRNAEDIA